MQGWGRQVDEGKQQPRGSWRKRKTELPGGPKAHSRGPWVPVRPEWLLGLAEPSTLGGRTNLRCGVPRARVGGGECPFLVEPLSCRSIFLHQGFGLGWAHPGSCCPSMGCLEAQDSQGTSPTGQPPVQIQHACARGNLPGWQRCPRGRCLEAFGMRRARCELCVRRGERGQGLPWGTPGRCDSPFTSSGIPELQLGSLITPPGHLKVPQPLPFGVTSDFRGWGRGPWGLGGVVFRIICLHQIPRRPPTTIHREVPGHPSTLVTVSLVPTQRPSRAPRFQLLL